MFFFILDFNDRFREKLPQMIHSRKDPHVLYEELVQIAKWRLMVSVI